MESLESALRYLVSLAKPETQEVGGNTYWTATREPVRKPFPATLALYSLSALAEYMKSPEALGLMSPFAIIDGPERVTLHLAADGISRREACVVKLKEAPDRLRFGEWNSLMEFIIKLQAQFLDTPARATLLQVLGNITGEAARTETDDGVTQRVATRVGVALADTATIVNPVELAPFRTFPEVGQPISPFIVRVRGAQEKQVALFEADGGAWRNMAVTFIRSWLNANAPGLVVMG